nr:MAG TPA: hypothetical protein [Caudoviricetes sp.]
MYTYLPLWHLLPQVHDFIIHGLTVLVNRFFLLFLIFLDKNAFLP